MREVLEQLSRGEITVDEAASQLAVSGIAALDDFARLDIGRHGRKGIPEVVYAPGKSVEQLLGICGSLLEHSGRAILSGIDNGQLHAVDQAFGDKVAVAVEEAGCLVLREPGHDPGPTGGRIGILSAGTADIRVAEQARVIAEEMGCEVIKAYDVGVAGVHRLLEPLRQMVEARAGALVVAAGMEGALPSVVAGLVPVPVIGLPTSTGYGFGGDGVAALMSMLQSCCPGLVAVNIDNGVGAGATAALIANNAATVNAPR
ncbi:MAG: nickel pincer cofactor biosynthesis protein LarB [Gaiellales bacterium]|nr:MAG: nickel pincer cofactor biosynthesis protein LarB [Gaiellales bacterium]